MDTAQYEVPAPHTPGQTAGEYPPDTQLKLAIPAVAELMLLFPVTEDTFCIPLGPEGADRAVGDAPSIKDKMTAPLVTGVMDGLCGDEAVPVALTPVTSNGVATSTLRHTWTAVALPWLSLVVDSAVNDVSGTLDMRFQKTARFASAVLLV